MMHSYLRAARTEILQSLTAILSLRHQTVLKEDASYVTPGDLALQSLLLDLAARMLPSARIVSEERTTEQNRGLSTGEIIIIDPIDGTENFASGFPMWGVSISCYRDGIHQASLIGCPELNQWLLSGEVAPPSFHSRIRGLSSSLTKEEILTATHGFEYRILGCCVYNMLATIRGSFLSFENPKGAWPWDILAGLNLALEAGLTVTLENQPYAGQYLTPDRKYRFKVGY